MPDVELTAQRGPAMAERLPQGLGRSLHPPFELDARSACCCVQGLKFSLPMQDQPGSDAASRSTE